MALLMPTPRESFLDLANRFGDCGLILSRVQDETNPLVLLPSGFVARSFQTAAGMRLARVSPAGKNPARLNLILKAH